MPEFHPDGHVQHVDLQFLRRKALAEFPGKPAEKIAEISRVTVNKLDSVLADWASENHFERRETWQGGVWTLWFPCESVDIVHRKPLSSVELLLNHVLPAKFVPLAEMLATLSSDCELALRSVLASLALRDLDANNIDGAVRAMNALDENPEHVRTLAEERLNNLNTLTENLQPANETNIERGKETAAEILAQYDKLVRQGTDSRDIAEKIVRRLKNRCTARHVRRILRNAKKDAQ